MSTTLSLPALPTSAPQIRTREQLDALLENIVQLHRERDGVWRAQEADLDRVRQNYRGQLTEIVRCLEVETQWAEAWVASHRSFLGSAGVLETEHVTLGFRAEPPRVERASRRWTWSRIASALAAQTWGARYLRTPEPIVDQEALAADLASLSPEALRSAGLRVVAGERFFVTPRTVGTEAPAPSGDLAWQEAA